LMGFWNCSYSMVHFISHITQHRSW